MDISHVLLTILGSTLGSLVLNYFWLRHLRTDLTLHIGEISTRLDKHIDETKQETIRKYNLLIKLNERMDKLYQCAIKRIGQASSQ